MFVWVVSLCPLSAMAAHLKESFGFHDYEKGAPPTLFPPPLLLLRPSFRTIITKKVCFLLLFPLCFSPLFVSSVFACFLAT